MNLTYKNVFRKAKDTQNNLFHVPCQEVLARVLCCATVDVASICSATEMLSNVFFDKRLMTEDVRSEIQCSLNVVFVYCSYLQS